MNHQSARSRLPGTVRWPPPLPARPRWAWLLGTRLRRWRLRRVLRPVAGLLPTSATVVDVGSGPGYDAVELLRLAPPGRVARWILVDPQREMLAQSRSTVLTELSRTGLAGLMVADAAALPIANETVDVVLSLGVLCCMSDASVGPAIDETSRVLRPGGWVVFGVPRRRGDTDLPRWREAGLEMAERVRPGAGLLRKRI